MGFEKKFWFTSFGPEAQCDIRVEVLQIHIGSDKVLAHYIYHCTLHKVDAEFQTSMVVQKNRLRLTYA